jgi:hypothetical protein
MRVPAPEDFRSRLRSAAVAARVGVWLGVCFGLCFVTGLVSHYAQDPGQPIPFPTSPSWGYRVTQGVHVMSGVAAVPLLLVKLWTVYPRLFLRPARGLRRLAVDLLERASIGVLVAAAIFQLATGLANATRWYPWDFSFRPTHYAVAWIAVGSLLVHIAAKLPITRDVLRRHVDDTTHDRASATEPGVLTRRGLLRTTWVAGGAGVLATAGAAVPLLRHVSLFAVNSGDGPQGIPINKTAAAAGVSAVATAGDYRLEIRYGERTARLARADLERLNQRIERLPIACVEGWSAGGDWTGVRLRELLDLVEGPAGSDVLVTSLQAEGPFRETTLPGSFADDERTLLALALDGEPLALDHGYPCRLIAPNRPGVLQTKWVGRLEVVT